MSMNENDVWAGLLEQARLRRMLRLHTPEEVAEGDLKAVRSEEEVPLPDDAIDRICRGALAVNAATVKGLPTHGVPSINGVLYERVGRGDSSRSSVRVLKDESRLAARVSDEHCIESSPTDVSPVVDLLIVSSRETAASKSVGIQAQQIWSQVRVRLGPRIRHDVRVSVDTDSGPVPLGDDWVLLSSCFDETLESLIEARLHMSDL